MDELIRSIINTLDKIEKSKGIEYDKVFKGLSGETIKINEPQKFTIKDFNKSHGGRK